VRLFLNGAIKIVNTALWPRYPNRNVFNDCWKLLSASFRCGGILFYSPGPAAANAISQKRMLVSQCMLCSLWNVVVAHKPWRHFMQYRLGDKAKSTAGW